MVARKKVLIVRRKQSAKLDLKGDKFELLWLLSENTDETMETAFDRLPDINKTSNY
jgi:hypothetical protein